MSLLSWERGLKYRASCHLKALIYVAPLVGAWIEIIKNLRRLVMCQSLLSWERGLK